jgi:hypothetical protein
MEEESPEREEPGSDEGDPDDPDEQTISRSIDWPGFLREDIIDTLIHDYPLLTTEIQGILLFRRPVASLSLIILINAILFTYRWANLTFLSLGVLILTVYLSTDFLTPAIADRLKDFFFPGECAIGQPPHPNRIRDPDEFAAYMRSLLSPAFITARLVYAVATDPSPFGYLSISLMFLSLAVLTAAVDFFWIIVVFVNSILIVPGVWLQPIVQRYWIAFYEEE